MRRLKAQIYIFDSLKVSDVTLIRLGTSGGVGVEPGTVVVSSGAMSGKLRESYELDINGERTFLIYAAVRQ